MPVPSAVSIFGPGILTQFTDSSGVNYTTMGLHKDVSGPGMEMGKTDVSTMDMPGRTRLYDPELVTPGAISTEIFFRPDNATHAAMFANLKAGQFLNFKRYLDAAGTHYLTGGGFFTKFEPKSAVAGSQTATIEFQVSGEITFN